MTSRTSDDTHLQVQNDGAPNDDTANRPSLDSLPGSSSPLPKRTSTSTESSAVLNPANSNVNGQFLPSHSSGAALGSGLGPWKDTHERRDTVSTVTGQIEHTHSSALEPPVTQAPPPSLIVEPSFDEGVLRALCELDCSVPLLLDRIKQSMVSCREVSNFFKKRAAIEEEYGRTLQKITRTTSDAYAMNDGKAGSFVSAWQSSLRTHELLAENRLRFSQRLLEMSDELNTLMKEVEKNRKQTKDLATRYERALQDSESQTEKCKSRLDGISEELERVLLAKEGESVKEGAVHARNNGGGVGGGSGGGKRVLGKAVAKGGMLLKGKNPGNIQRQEDDIRARVSSATDQYRKAVTDTQSMRQEYFNFQLPRILRALKECADEIDLGTQYHLTRYAFLYESIVLSDGQILIPPDANGLGLKATIETIDNRSDFKTFMQHYVYAKGPGAPRGPRREGPAEDGFLPPLPTYNPPPSQHSHISTPTSAHPSTSFPTSTNSSQQPFTANVSSSSSHQHHPSVSMSNHTPPQLPAPGPNSNYTSTPLSHSLSTTPSLSLSSTTNTTNTVPSLANSGTTPDRGRPTFGVNLAEQMARDNAEVPPIVIKCCAAIEKHGINSQGIYRMSGATKSVNALRAKLDRDLDAVDLDSPEWSGDINTVTSVLKMWLRELPEPLLTYALQEGFLEAAKIENDRLRHIRLHERVNDLPDPNYSTLKFFLGHLYRVNKHASENQMSMQNLAIVFGPTLFGLSPTGANGQMMDTYHQNLAIETILNHYVDIFVDDSDA